MTKKPDQKDFVLAQGPLGELLQTFASLPRGQTPSEEWFLELLSKTRRVIESAPAPVPEQMKSLNLDDEELLIFGVLLASAFSPSGQNILQSPAAPPGVPLSNLFQVLPPPVVLRCLRSGGKLRQSNLVEATTVAGRHVFEDPLVRIPWRIPNLFLGILEVSPVVAPFAVLEFPAEGLLDLPLADEIRQQAFSVYGERPGTNVPPTCIAVVGTKGSGRTTFVKALSRHLQRPSLILDGALLSGLDPLHRMEVIKEAHLDSAWLGAFLCFTGASALLSCPDIQGLVRSLFGLGCPHHTALVLDEDVEVPCPDLFVARFFMPSADRFLRVQVWEHVIPPEIEVSKGLDLDLLAARYELSPAGIRNAMALCAVKSIAKGSQKVEAQNLEESASNQLVLGPSRFVHVKRPKGTLERLVVPPDVMKKLRFLVAAAKSRVEVMTKWGFDEILTSGKGITALFTGEAGTGKTFCAELIAGELGVDLWHVDLSAIVSKYVGETEKNIHDLFSVTRARPLVLLLDEADALFGQRVEVKTATDKFANLEINVLLQELDRFEGVLILTSNLPENIDQAFRRRLLVHVQFRAPDILEREELWRKLVPPSVPLAPDVDFAYLAKCFELTGGFIRNAILCAAYAGRERGVVTMNDLMSAALEQAQAAGKLARIT
jgi:energy-coupling factor transporter ATP-binding protein EcfA2